MMRHGVMLDMLSNVLTLLTPSHFKIGSNEESN